MRSACDFAGQRIRDHLLPPGVARNTHMPAFQLVHGGRDRCHIAPDAPIADEGAVAAEAWIARDRDPSAFRLAATELIDEVAERAPRLEVGEVSLRIGAAFRDLLQEVEAKAAEHAVRRDAGEHPDNCLKARKSAVRDRSPRSIRFRVRPAPEARRQKERAPQASFRRRSPNVRTQLLLAPAPSPLRCRSRAHPSMTPVMPP